MKIANKVKAIIISVVYALVLFIQFYALTPYTKTETYISSQNVPHTVTFDTGYDSFKKTNYEYTDKKGKTIREQVNYNLFIFQLALTTAAAVFAYYFLCYKKYTLIADDNANEQSDLKTQNVQMEQSIDNLLMYDPKQVCGNTKKVLAYTVLSAITIVLLVCSAYLYIEYRDNQDIIYNLEEQNALMAKQIEARNSV